MWRVFRVFDVDPYNNSCFDCANQFRDGCSYEEEIENTADWGLVEESADWYNENYVCKWWEGKNVETS